MLPKWKVESRLVKKTEEAATDINTLTAESVSSNLKIGRITASAKELTTYIAVTVVGVVVITTVAKTVCEIAIITAKAKIK